MKKAINYFSTVLLILFGFQALAQLEHGLRDLVRRLRATLLGRHRGEGDEAVIETVGELRELRGRRSRVVHHLGQSDAESDGTGKQKDAGRGSGQG